MADAPKQPYDGSNTDDSQQGETTELVLGVRAVNMDEFSEELAVKIVNAVGVTPPPSAENILEQLRQDPQRGYQVQVIEGAPVEGVGIRSIVGYAIDSREFLAMGEQAVLLLRAAVAQKIKALMVGNMEAFATSHDIQIARRGSDAAARIIERPEVCQALTLLDVASITKSADAIVAKKTLLVAQALINSGKSNELRAQYDFLEELRIEAAHKKENGSVEGAKKGAPVVAIKMTICEEGGKYGRGQGTYEGNLYYHPAVILAEPKARTVADQILRAVRKAGFQSAILNFFYLEDNSTLNSVAGSVPSKVRYTVEITNL
jgi:hypothetical protein